MDYSALPLESQVAQLFMLGYSGAEPNPVTHRFLARGLGGLIFFRDNFDTLSPQTPQAVWELLQGLQATIPDNCPRLLLGIDQEGGQVERLPHTVFPTGLSPRAVALSPDPEGLAQKHYAALADRLVTLGFNLDFFPTLDVNYQRKNPIIGVRSFGDDPQTVWQLGQVALQCFELTGLIAVGKHFPGHGNGTVDSHLDLPTLHYTPEELQPFQRAIQAGLPAMLVSHGYYPALQSTDFERSLPSSASPAVIQGLLREQCGFKGVIITDDLCMGAITKHRSPIEAAIASLKAGVDILLYKQSTETEWAVYEAVVEAFRTGALPLSLLHQSLERIANLKAEYLKGMTPPLVAQDWSPKALADEADQLATEGIGRLSGDSQQVPIPLQARVLVIHPERARMGNYAFDVPTSPDLAALLQQAGFQNITSQTYPPRESFSAPAILDTLLPGLAIEQTKTAPAPDVILMITFNPVLHTDQAELYRLLKQQFAGTPIVLASAGTPYDQDGMPNPTLHISLCSYRPATLRALVKLVQAGFPIVARQLPEAVAEQL
jgi:beta-N-acetylhexosaminidase